MTKAKTITALESVIRDQANLLERAKRQRLPAAVRRAMVDVLDHAFREVNQRSRKRATRSSQERK